MERRMTAPKDERSGGCGDEIVSHESSSDRHAQNRGNHASKLASTAY